MTQTPDATIVSYENGNSATTQRPPWELVEWVKSGEEVILMEEGKSFAKLVPFLSPPQEAEVDWSTSPLVTRDRSNGRKLTKEEYTAFFEELRG